MQSSDVDLDGACYVLLAYRTQQSTEMYNPVDAMLYYGGLDALWVEHVNISKRTVPVELGQWFDDVRRDHILRAILFPRFANLESNGTQTNN